MMVLRRLLLTSDARKLFHPKRQSHHCLETLFSIFKSHKITIMKYLKLNTLLLKMVRNTAQMERICLACGRSSVKASTLKKRKD